MCHEVTSPILRDPVVRKNHNVSHCDILLSLDLKFKEQEGAGPSMIRSEREGAPERQGSGQRATFGRNHYLYSGERE